MLVKQKKLIKQTNSSAYMSTYLITLYFYHLVGCVGYSGYIIQEIRAADANVVKCLCTSYIRHGKVVLIYKQVSLINVNTQLNG